MAETDFSKAVPNEPVKTESAASEGTLPDTHWLHLADGRVVTTKGVMSHYDGLQVIGAYPMPETSEPTSAHKF
jgi:hypothetical protein